MFEYEIVRILRNKEKKTREVEVKSGKFKTETYVDVEPWDEFDIRVKTTINRLAVEGWQVISASYNLPTKSVGGTFAFSSGETYTMTDFELAEYVFVLQRQKPEIV